MNPCDVNVPTSTNAKPNFDPGTHEERRRHRFIAKVQEQLCLAEAQLGGVPYKRKRWITTADGQGEPQRVQRPVRLKAVVV